MQHLEDFGRYCISQFTHTHAHTHTHVYKHIYIHLHLHIYARPAHEHAASGGFQT